MVFIAMGHNPMKEGTGTTGFKPVTCALTVTFLNLKAKNVQRKDRRQFRVFHGMQTHDH